MLTLWPQWLAIMGGLGGLLLLVGEIDNLEKSQAGYFYGAILFIYKDVSMNTMETSNSR